MGIMLTLVISTLIPLWVWQKLSNVWLNGEQNATTDQDITPVETDPTSKAQLKPF